MAVIQQLYVNLEVRCEGMQELCNKSYYSTSKLAAAHVMSKMERAMR